MTHEKPIRGADVCLYSGIRVMEDVEVCIVIYDVSARRWDHMSSSANLEVWQPLFHIRSSYPSRLQLQTFQVQANARE
jgi:hypothetical protein